MTLTAFTFTFLLGGVFGAALMLLAVVRAESWRAQQRDQAASKLERVRKNWNSMWLKEARRADRAEARLAVIHEQHVEAGRKGGKTVHQQYRARIVEVARSLPLQPLRPRDEVIKDNSLLPEKRRAA